MTRPPRSFTARLGPAPPTRGAGRPPPRLRAWLGAIVLLGALGSIACDEGGDPGAGDRGASDAAADAITPDARRPDAMPPDAALDAMPPDAALDAALDAMPPDAAPDASPDAMPPDAMPPDAAPPAQATPPAVTAGGATVESARHRLRLSVGGPAPTHVTSSQRLKARIGVALPLPDTEE